MESDGASSAQPLVKSTMVASMPAAFRSSWIWGASVDTQLVLTDRFTLRPVWLASARRDFAFSVS